MSNLQQLYQTIILDHSKGRHGSCADPLEELPAAVPGEARVGQSHQVNTSCGDDITLRVTLGPAGVEAHVDDLVWRGDGCSISMASASVLNDELRGLSVAEAQEFLETFRTMLRSRGTIEPDEEVLGDAAAFGGVSRYPARVKCAMLPWVAFEAAVHEAESR